MKQINLIPTAKLAVKRNVLKKYKVDNQEVYFLKDGTEFEIELFNPTNEKILCKIEFNSNHLWNSEGLVLRPGERVFLERYLDSDKKFKFETYNVPDTTEAQNAIVENGNVRVSFFSEVVYYYTSGTIYTTSPTYTSPSIWNPNIFTCNTITQGSTSNQVFSYIDANISYCNSGITNDVLLGKNTVATQNSGTSTEIETGIITKGSKSNQAFSYVDDSFNSLPFHVESFKILPDSKKVLTTDDIKHKKYCSECGSKIKHTDKYCSNCGNKL